MHLAAVLFLGAGLLLLTVPLHLIYGVISARQSATAEAGDAAMRIRCPACREEVRRDATLCKHCHSTLTPTAPPVQRFEERHGLAIAVGTIAAMVLIAKACT